MGDAKKKDLQNTNPSVVPGRDEPSLGAGRGRESQTISSAVPLSDLSDLTGLLENLSHKLVHLAFLVASMADEDEELNHEPREQAVDPFELVHSHPASKMIN